MDDSSFVVVLNFDRIVIFLIIFVWIWYLLDCFVWFLTLFFALVLYLFKYLLDGLDYELANDSVEGVQKINDHKTDEQDLYYWKTGV